jgi:hypothetical protein
MTKINSEKTTKKIKNFAKKTVLTILLQISLEDLFKAISFVATRFIPKPTNKVK